MEDKPNYYAILTANVRYDKRLRDKAKLLYAEITALSNKNGFCFANNTYFANLYGVSNTTISTLISELEKYGYIKVSIDIKKGNERKIYVKNCTPLKEILNTYLKNFKNPLKENLKHNNIYINNKSNNNKENNKEKMKIASYPELKSAIKEDYLYKIASIYKLNKKTTLSLLDAFVNINKDKKSNEFKFCQHFENWLQTDKGQQAINSTRITSNITNNYQQD